jgi:hypothetical protein
VTDHTTWLRVSRAGRALGVGLMLATFFVGTVSAQVQQPILTQGEVTTAPGGWSVTPGVALGGTLDSNVLYRGQGSQIDPDFLTLVNPRGNVDYSNRRTRFSAGYSGTFSLYSQLDELNSFDQVVTAAALHEATPRLSLSVQGSMVDVPTTEWFPLVGVPFLRIGTQVGELRGGFDARMSKRNTLSGSYRAMSVGFDETEAFPSPLIGGWGHGANVMLRHQRDERLALTAEFDLQRSLAEGRGTFVIQTVWGGFEHRLTNVMRVSAAAGIARLTGDSLLEPNNGPALRASFTRNFRRWLVDAMYYRSFVPSLGIGGTQQNEEVQGRVDVTLTRKSTLNASVAWRRNQPLEPFILKLTSVWVQGGYAYALRPWMRFEAYYSAAHQRIDQPGGLADRHRAGVQMVTGLPVRIR